MNRASDNHERLVSIIIPTYNRADLVVEAIESALSQSHEEIEVVVIDDGSTDDTPKRVEQYIGRIKYRTIPNRGVAFARNFGIKLASGRFVQFLDSDDILDQSSVERQVNAFFKKACKCYVPVGKVGTLCNDGIRLKESNRYNLRFDRAEESEINLNTLSKQSFQVSMPLYERSALLKIGGFRVGLSLFEDYDLNLRLRYNGAHFFSSGVTISYMRAHSGPRLTTLHSKAQLRDALGMFASHESFFLENGEASDAFAERIWSVGRLCARQNYHALAAEYFYLARRVAPAIKPRGSLSYRFLCNIFGPFYSERVVSVLKKSPLIWREK